MNSTASEQKLAATAVSESEPVNRIHATNLTKRYEMRTVLRNVDLTVQSGECVVLFGPNGAGKTTLLRVLSTLTRPQSGSLSINDLDVSSDAIEARSHIGVVAHQPYVYDSLTARENLQFFSRMYAIERSEERIDEVLRRVELFDRADDQVGTFSRGMIQRIALARAILHSPSVLLFDEPDTGLDFASVRVLEGILTSHCRDGGTVLTTTHDLGFGLRIATRVLVMVQGKVHIDEPVDAVDPDTIQSIMGAPGA